jgi:hypothetical protein
MSLQRMIDQFRESLVSCGHRCRIGPLGIGLGPGGSVVCGLAGAVSRAFQSTYLFAVAQLVMVVDVVAQREFCDFLREVRVARCSYMLSCVCSAVPCCA